MTVDNEPGHPDWSSPELQWLRPYAAKPGDTCRWCGYAFQGGEPFCGRFCEVQDPAVRWDVVILADDLDVEASAVLGHRVRCSTGEPFTDEENALAGTETRSECAVRFALCTARTDAAAAELAAGDWPPQEPG